MVFNKLLLAFLPSHLRRLSASHLLMLDVSRHAIAATI